MLRGSLGFVSCTSQRVSVIHAIIISALGKTKAQTNSRIWGVHKRLSSSGVCHLDVCVDRGGCIDSLTFALSIIFCGNEIDELIRAWPLVHFIILRTPVPSTVDAVSLLCYMNEVSIGFSLFSFSSIFSSRHNALVASTFSLSVIYIPAPNLSHVTSKRIKWHLDNQETIKNWLPSQLAVRRRDQKREEN